MFFFNSDKGYVTLISVLTTSAVGLVIVVSILLLGISNSRTVFSREASVRASGLADACAEEALRQIRDTTSFTGSGSITFGQDSCSYTVVSGVGQNRIIRASGLVSGVVRKIQVNIDTINPQINVVSWINVVDF